MSSLTPLSHKTTLPTPLKYPVILPHQGTPPLPPNHVRRPHRFRPHRRPRNQTRHRPSPPKTRRQKRGPVSPQSRIYRGGSCRRDCRIISPMETFLWEKGRGQGQEGGGEV